MASDHELVRAARRGSPAALASIFDRHWPTVWRAAYAVTRRRELADDVAQDAFLRAASALERFDERRSLAPWLARIAVNRAIDLMRRERQTTPMADIEAQAASDRGEDRELHDAVAALPLERRTVVVLHFFLGFTLEESAEILDIPAGTVASRLSRALTSLRAALEAANHV